MVREEEKVVSFRRCAVCRRFICEHLRESSTRPRRGVMEATKNGFLLLMPDGRSYEFGFVPLEPYLPLEVQK